MKSLLITLCLAAAGLSMGGCALDVAGRGYDDRHYYSDNGYYRGGGYYSQPRYYGYAPQHRYHRPAPVVVRPGGPRIYVRD